MQVPFYTIFLFVFVSAVIEFFALKKQAGFKNELMARHYLYQLVAGLLTIAFITAAPLNSISPTLQFVVGIALLVLNVIFSLYLKKNAEILKK